MSTAAIGAAIAILTSIGAAMGVAISASKGSESIARQPEKAGEIRNLSFLGMVLSEATAIYGLLVALMLISKI